MRPFVVPEASLGNLDAAVVSTLLSAATDIALIIDGEGVIRDIATGSEDLAREDYAVWMGRRWTDTVADDSRTKVEQLLRDASEAGSASQQPRWRQVNQVLADGRQLPVLFAALRVDPNSRDRSLALGRDLRATAALQQRLVEAQQAMERDYWKFRQAETRYRHLFQVASEAVLVLDATNNKVIEANPAAGRLLGDVNQLIGHTFPCGLDGRSTQALTDLLASVRATGRADEVHAELQDANGEVVVSVSTYRQDRVAQFLVRINPVADPATLTGAPNANSLLLRLAHSAPDCLVVADLEGRILSANLAFLELAQLNTEDQARGESLDRWLGRTGVDLSVLISNLRQRGAVRLFATTLRGEYGSVTDVEISAAMVPFGDHPFLGFTIRDVGRRLTSEPRAGRELPRSVGQLTELVGRVPMKDIVSETTDLIEQLCIEAALELTRDNRASAAEMLGLSRQSLYVKLRRYGLVNPGDDSADKERSTTPQ